eukprot:TRINITY_DN11753_c0_g1_i1.p1 TRINITY_DN11753_c0_g1~~TRINITY_DN11753_c0_g1_i1.p1  ORF type:complete len:263 (-),score=60.98 TRINITY_DN11753_c0_g1_i1:78-866(-)
MASSSQNQSAPVTEAKTSSGIVKLNVGGQIFTTSKSTLLKGTSSEGSFFSSMLSGRFSVETDESGNFFIDRSGEKFKHILEFLRTGALESNVDLDSLLQEAQFYLLDDLIYAIEHRKQIETELKRSAASPAVRLDGIYRSPGGRCLAFIDDHRYVLATGEGALSSIIGFLLGSPIPAKWQQTGLAEEFAMFCVNNVSRGTYWLENENKLTLLVDNSKYVAAVAAIDSIHVLLSGKFVEHTFISNAQLAKRHMKPEPTESEST